MPKELSKLGKYLEDNGQSRTWLANKLFAKNLYKGAEFGTVYWRLVRMCIGRTKFFLSEEKREIAKILRCEEDEIFEEK